MPNKLKSRGEIMHSCNVNEYNELSLKNQNKLGLNKFPVAIKLV